MIASEKFHIDQPVTMTEKAITQGLDGGVRKKRQGVVVGFPVQGFGDVSKLVYVIRNGNRTKQSYHMDFWEPANGR